MDILHFFLVFAHRAQRPVEKSALLPHAPFAPAAVKAQRGAYLDRFQSDKTNRLSRDMPAHYTPVTRTSKRKAAESLKRETLIG